MDYGVKYWHVVARAPAANQLEVPSSAALVPAREVDARPGICLSVEAEHVYRRRVSPRNRSGPARAAPVLSLVLLLLASCRRHRSDCEQVALVMTGKAHPNVPSLPNANGDAGTTGLYPDFMFKPLVEQCVDTFDDEMIACVTRSDGDLAIVENCVAALRARTGRHSP